MHNDGYEQGVTKIDKDGVQVQHSNINTKTRLSADGLYILDENNETIASLASKESWSTLKADKVFAQNIQNNKNY